MSGTPCARDDAGLSSDENGVKVLTCAASQAISAASSRQGDESSRTDHPSVFAPGVGQEAFGSSRERAIWAEGASLQYGQALVAQARRAPGPYAADAEDIVQEALCRFLEGTITIKRRDGGSAAGWLIGVIRNLARHRVEAAARFTDLTMEDVDSQSPITTDPIATLSASRDLDQALQSLSASERDVVVRHFFNGEPIAAIAAARGTREQTVKELQFNSTKSVPQTWTAIPAELVNRGGHRYTKS